MPVICITLAERHLGSKLFCLGFNNRMYIGKVDNVPPGKANTNGSGDAIFEENT